MTDAHSLVRALGGRWHMQGQYGLCPCPGNIHRRGDKRPSLKVTDGNHGPMVHCFAGCDWHDIRALLSRRGLIDDHLGRKYHAWDRAEMVSLRKQREEQAATADAKRSNVTRKVWGKCTLACLGGLADTYLKSRGLWLPEIDAIRESSGLKHSPSDQIFPAMVCRIDLPNGFGLHRTYLQPGGFGKARVDGNKSMLGKCSGGGVQLFPAAEKMSIAEGIETALAVHKLSGLPVWAALSTSGLINLALPDDVREVVIAADHDENGAGERAANAAAKRWCAEGRNVEITMPSVPGTDWLDHLREVA